MSKISNQTDLLLSKIRLDGGTQPRAALNEDLIGEYAARMDAGDEFPPVVVFYDGKTYWLGDGFHRVFAAQRNKAKNIAADVRQGTLRDAVLHSVSANAGHGLRRTQDDKRRAILTLLNDPEWRKWTDRSIATKCAVDHKTVASLRKGHLGNSPDGGKAEPRKTERNGKAHTVTTAPIAAANISRAANRTKPAGAPEIVSPVERAEAMTELTGKPYYEGVKSPAFLDTLGGTAKPFPEARPDGKTKPAPDICPNCGERPTQYIIADGSHLYTSEDKAYLCGNCEGAVTLSVTVWSPRKTAPTVTIAKCPHCKKEIEAGDPFCDNCGTPLD